MYTHDPANPLTVKPKFAFTAKNFRCEKVESGSCEWSQILVVNIVNKYGEPCKNIKYTRLSLYEYSMVYCKKQLKIKF